MNIRQAATSKVTGLSTSPATKTDVVRPGEGTGQAAGAMTPYASQAQQLLEQLEQKYSQVDSHMLKGVNSDLEREFHGKSPQQVAAKREELLREAKQRFGSDPRTLQVVEQMINHHTRRQSTGFSSPPATGRQGLTSPAGKLNPQTEMQRP